MKSGSIVAGLAAAVCLLAQEPSGVQSVPLRTGETLRGQVDRQPSDLVINLFQADGAKIVEFDGFDDGPEPFCYIARQAGVFRLEVRDTASNRPLAAVISHDQSHPATDQDRVFCRAVEESTQAKNLQAKAGAANLEGAVARSGAALSLWKDLGNRSAELRTLNRLGTLQHSLSRYTEARDSFTQAISLSRQLGDRQSEGEALTGAGMASFRLGDVQPALDYSTAALNIWKDLGSVYGQANAANNLGVLYYPMGEWQTAIDYHLQALALVRTLGDRRGEAFTLNNLGVAYDALGQPETAARYLADALRLFRATGLRAAAGRTLGVMGRIALARNQPQTALVDQQEALTLAVSEGDKRSEAEALERIGETWDKLENPARAEQFYRDSLAKFQVTSNRQGEAQALHQLGLSEIRRGSISSGMESLDRALAIRRDTGLSDRVAVSLLDIARVERDRGRLSEARADIEAALDLIEALRTRIAEPSLRTSYFATRADWYSFYIDLLMRMHRESPEMGFDRLAFTAAERARARSFLDILGEARVQVRKGADPMLLDEERVLGRQLNLQATQWQALSAGAVSPRENVLRLAVNDTLTRLQQVEMHIRENSPGYARLTQASLISLDDIQRQFLDPDTLLLQYSLGQEASYLWVVSNDSLRSFRLPGRALVEAEATRFLEDAGRRNADSSQSASALTRSILAPAKALLGQKRLVVVADGTVLSVPFAALPDPERGDPLMVAHEIVSIPSASALAGWREDHRAELPANSLALVVADPVFDRDDPRVAARPGGSRLPMESIPLARLPFTRDEAQKVADALGHSRTRLALGFDARKSLLTGPEGAQFGLLHLATHGLWTSSSPALSALAFSQVDSVGRPLDGFLRLYEIFNLNLRANLVVLSACESGLGDNIRGEGIIGLTRAFMYAGSPRIVVAQWSVDDEATSDLMNRFYRLQSGARGLRPAAALRAAQLQAWRQPRWRSSYYWGSFVFHGEWR
jgi:CHAT domain-containing protein/tetratricopeptide (TPR) repeat protein